MRRGRSGVSGPLGDGRRFQSSAARRVAGPDGGGNAPPVGDAGSSSSGAGRFQPAINPPAAGRRGMSGDSTTGGGSGSYNRAFRVGGWNSDSPPGLTATPNGGGGSCGTRRGNGGTAPAEADGATPLCPPASVVPRRASP
jgi:hypothetical protein